MKVSQYLGLSMIDYPEKLSAVLFTGDCNWRCNACHGKEILENIDNYSEEKIFNLIDLKKNWIDGVVLCGGEPTQEPDIVHFIRKLKGRELLVKLDTNGSNYSVLQELLDDKLVDYVAMDVKGPLYLYDKIVGKHVDLRDDVEKGMSIVPRFPRYEFRTTIVPVIRENETRFLNPVEMMDTARWMVDNTQSNEHNYYIQKFVPNKGKLINKELESFPETPVKLMNDIYSAVKEYLPYVKVR
ncbi:MAG: anaerobic ribonucleoside-triphosphate reductase activating protein [Candidatus Pacearchaeota archaeon]|jgi:pyruvate formate lyase activating enzyme